jgi:hypothetical protein
MSSEWVAVIAAIWAAFATTWAAVATSRAIAVSRKAPIDAAQIAASLQDASERRRLKLWVFATIMQNRQFLAEADSVGALNLIDTVFHDVPPVRDAWANFFAALNDQRKSALRRYRVYRKSRAYSAAACRGAPRVCMNSIR